MGMNTAAATATTTTATAPAPAPASAIHYEMLAGPAMRELAEMGYDFNPMLAVAFVARDDSGRIRAQCIIHGIPMVEYTEAEPGWGQALGALFRMAQSWIMEYKPSRVLMHTESPAMERMLRRAGAVPWPTKMWQWLRPATVAKGER